MKQVLQNYRTGELKVHDVPPPAVAKGRVVVETRSSLISAGTERSTVTMANKSLAGKAMARPDLVAKVVDKVKKDGVVDTLKMVNGRLDSLAALGYSSAGIVVEVGEDVTEFAVGDRVACAGQNYASHAEVVQIPKNLCMKIPEGVEFDEAAYVAIGSIAMQGLRQAEPQLGETVAVIGLGLLGLILVQMLKANGCKVVATDLDKNKLALAKEFGVDITVGPEQFVETCLLTTASLGVDSVIITASTKSDVPVSEAAEACRKKGKVVVVGAVGMNLPREPYYMKELELRLSTSYGPGRYDSSYEEGGIDYPYAYVRWSEKRNMESFLRLLATQQVSLDKITTHRFPIDDAEDAYGMIASGSEPYMGIVLQYSSENTQQKLSRKISLSPKISSKGSLGISIIGPGSHVKDMLLPHIKSANGFGLRGVCSAGGVSARQAADRFGASFACSAIDEVLGDKETDVVLIGTRHDSHVGIALAALEAGKHVFLEKPLAITREQLQQVEAFYESRSGEDNVPALMLGFNRRYSSHAQKIKSQFRGRLNPMVINYRVNAGAIPPEHWIQSAGEGGGRIIGEACHFIDFMQFIVGAPVTSVFSRSIGKHSSGITSDNAMISIGFEDGSIGNLIYVSEGDKKVNKEFVEVFCDGGVAIMDDYMKTDIYRHSKKTTFKSSGRDKGFEAEIQFLGALVSGKESAEQTISDAILITKATFAAQESMITGQSYELANF